MEQTIGRLTSLFSNSVLHPALAISAKRQIQWFAVVDPPSVPAFLVRLGDQRGKRHRHIGILFSEWNRNRGQFLKERPIVDFAFRPRVVS
jgi:hypothetical protein